jgi:hypothetical protein
VAALSGLEGKFADFYLTGAEEFSYEAQEGSGGEVSAVSIEEEGAVFFQEGGQVRKEGG